MYYIHECSDTGKVFICQTGVDNNIAEVFARNENETAKDNAQLICDALNLNRIVIACEGGIVQSVNFNVPNKTEVVVIDYDTENGTHKIPQSEKNNDTSDACIDYPITGIINKHIDDYLDTI